MPERFTICRPASSLRVRLPIGLSVGGSFTGLTVRRKLVEEDAPLPSVTVIVMGAVPNWLGSGVITSIRLALLPKNTMLALGTSARLEDTPDTVRESMGESMSPRVKDIGGVAESSLIV